MHSLHLRKLRAAHSAMTSLGRQTDCPSLLAASALATVQSLSYLLFHVNL